MVGYGVDIAEVWMHGGDAAPMGATSKDGSRSTCR